MARIGANNVELQGSPTQVRKYCINFLKVFVVLVRKGEVLRCCVSLYFHIRF